MKGFLKGIYMKLISDDKKYFKHIRTYIDEIVCTYYNLYKESEIQNEIDLDYCQFSFAVYDIYDKAETIEQFISKLLDSISILIDNNDKPDRNAKALLNRIKELEKYHQRYLKLYKTQFV